MKRIILGIAALAVFQLMSVPAVMARNNAEDLSAISRKGNFHLAKLAKANACFKAEMEYPIFGRPALDQSVRAFAKRFFAQEVADLKDGCAQLKADTKAGIETEPKLQWYHVVRPQIVSTRRTVSIKFDIDAYTGGAHPNHRVRTLILNTNGKELNYDDLFANTEGLWTFLSEYARTALRPKMWEDWDKSSWVTDGLAPNAESFQYFLVTPKGLTLIFPDYQVAPYVLGQQHCGIPLAALAKFAPKPGIWK